MNQENQFGKRTQAQKNKDKQNRKKVLVFSGTKKTSVNAKKLRNEIYGKHGYSGSVDRKYVYMTKKVRGMRIETGTLMAIGKRRAYQDAKSR